MPYIQAAIDANIELYNTLYTSVDCTLFDYALETNQVGAGGDRSLVIDLLAEDTFIKYLSSYGQIHSEESGYIGEKNSFDIIIDPIDGSANISSGFPYYGSSVSFRRDGETIGAVIANLAVGEIFVKTEDKLYKFDIASNTIQSDLICQEPKLGLFEKAYSNPDIVKKLSDASFKFRSPGAVALSLAYAYQVKFVLFIGKHRIFDVDAGLFFCNNLHTYITEDCILICRDREIFEKLINLVGDGEIE
jgi:myo-inositol-1(or 4)-monophosphatase